MTIEALLESYSKYSVDFKFEESLRLEEINWFAKTVVPEPRFLFDEYDVGDKHEEKGVDYFSFF